MLKWILVLILVSFSCEMVKKSKTFTALEKGTKDTVQRIDAIAAYKIEKELDGLPDRVVKEFSRAMRKVGISIDKEIKRRFHKGRNISSLEISNAIVRVEKKMEGKAYRNLPIVEKYPKLACAIYPLQFIYSVIDEMGFDNLLIYHTCRTREQHEDYMKRGVTQVDYSGTLHNPAHGNGTAGAAVDRTDKTLLFKDSPKLRDQLAYLSGAEVAVCEYLRRTVTKGYLCEPGIDWYKNKKTYKVKFKDFFHFGLRKERG